MPDRIGSDPLLLAPAAREAKYLSAEPPVSVSAPAVAQPVRASAAGGDRITITNDGGNVMIAGEQHRLLRGGFGR